MPARLEKCKHMLKQQSKSVGKLRNVSALAKGVDKQVFPSLEICLKLPKEGFPEGAVKKVLAILQKYLDLLKEL